MIRPQVAACRHLQNDPDFGIADLHTARPSSLSGTLECHWCLSDPFLSTVMGLVYEREPASPCVSDYLVA
jgi:hypothetical protein